MSQPAFPDPIHYHTYLQLDNILQAQKLRSDHDGAEPAHDEMLFIIIHQVYELWFKQIIHELEDVIDMFEKDRVDERNIGTAVARFDRVIEIQKLLVAQIRVLETMTSLDFLEFRKYLYPASGFQSFQFRLVEVMLGLKIGERLNFMDEPYYNILLDEQRKTVQQYESGGSLFELVESWLERTPFLDFKGFQFLESYEAAVQRMLKTEKEAIQAATNIKETDKAARLEMIERSHDMYKPVFDPKEHAQLREAGQIKLSHKAFVAALLITLYRDEPILHMPYNLLNRLIDVDELFTNWRYRHAQMVMRMLGRKIGTGGSSGYEYLHATAVKHHVFSDFYNLSTLLIPRSELPELPATVKKELGYYYSVVNYEI